MTKTAALTDDKIKTARADRAKRLGLKTGDAKRDRFILTDTNGLFLDFDYTKRDETKRFTWRCWVSNGKGARTKSTLGYYPAMSIKDAREQAAKDRQNMAQQQVAGTTLVTPSVARRLKVEAQAKQEQIDAENAQRIEAGEYPVNTFGDLMQRVYAHDVQLWKGGEAGVTAAKFRRVMAAHVKGFFDHKHVSMVTVADINALRQRVLTADTKNKRKGGKTALQQALRFVGTVFDLAIDEKLIELKPIQEPTRKNAKKAQSAGKSVKHPGVVTLPLLGRVLRSIFAEQAPTRLDARDALLMVFLTVQRRDTVINMEWTEIDWQHREWRIPKDKMKKCGDVQAEHDHVVPLPQMAIDLLTIRWAAREMGKRKSRFVFPSRTLTNDFDSVDAKTGLKVAARGQSDTLMQELLNDNNWKGIHTTHGTRTSFRTIVVKEFGDIIMVGGKAYMTHLLCEIQLAHMNGEKMKEITANMPGTYYENDALVERRALMDKWAELIAKLLTETGPEEIGFMREQAALAAPTLSIAA